MAKSQLTVDTYTGKLSRLKEDALKLLGVSGLDTLDKLEPFGDSSNDFIAFYIYDLDDNYLGSGKIISIPTDGKLDVGAHLRGAGYERGDYKVVYNFLRLVGGSWKSVLVKKSDKSIYASDEPRWIDTNGKIYAGETGDTEEELLIKDYKYFLQEISPSRTEVRLAVNPGINDSDYLEGFRLMGYTCLSFTDRAGTAKIDGTGKKVEILNSSKNLIQKMVGGKLVIRDALVIGHDTTPQEIANYIPFKEILPCVDDTQSQISGLIEFSNTETLVATLNSDDNGFISRMRGGKITIKNAIRLMDAPIANFAFNIMSQGDYLHIPTAGFSWESTYLTIIFSNNSTDADGDALSFSWDFGDGNSSTDENPIHTYADEGTYTVSLTTSDASHSDTVSESVAVNAKPVSDRLLVNEVLERSQYLRSENGGYELHMQPDGNLVLYQVGPYGNAPLWSSGTQGTAASQLIMQGDGNLVLYALGTSEPTDQDINCYLARYSDLRAAFGNNIAAAREHYHNHGKNEARNPYCSDTGGGPSHWNSGTNNAAVLIVQDDGNLVLYTGTMGAVWATGTN